MIAGEDRERVLLVSMPFGPLERPSIGLGLLQGHCQRLGISCQTRYLNLSFAQLVGVNEYLWMTNSVPYTAFAGDWVFAEALYGRRPDADARYISEILAGQWAMAPSDIDRIRRMRDRAGAFLSSCLEAISWADYSLVGLTSVFQQNVASLGLATMLKARWPQLTVAAGGANWEQPMGLALRRRFPAIDLAFSGEADLSWPAVLEARRRGEPVIDIPGVASDDRSVSEPERLADLDRLPVPDFGPYFEQLRSSSHFSGVQPTLLVETARGCWWGERSQCAFCGLNGSSMAFRSKSPDRVVAEFTALRRAHDVGTISVVDDILDMRYLRTVLPRLADAALGVDIFWEVKANLTHRQVAQLRAAGVIFIQPGIESLSDHVLQLMRKGTTAARNIELLKWCREYGVTPLWNVLYGFPGETEQDYEEMASLLPALRHLPAPTGYGPIRLDRFSPYHADPSSFGMINVRPMASLRHLYPFDDGTQSEIAYYFDFDYHDGRTADGFADAAMAQIREWMVDSHPGSLWMRQFDDGSLHIADSRPQVATSPRRAVLRGWKATVFLACDRAQDVATLHALPDVQLAAIGVDELEAFLVRAAELRLVVCLAGRWLNLAVHTPARLCAMDPVRPPIPVAAAQRPRATASASADQ